MMKRALNILGDALFASILGAGSDGIYMMRWMMMDTEWSFRSLKVIRTTFFSTKDAADMKSLKEDFCITILPSFLEM